MKKPNLGTKVGRYYTNLKKGMTKQDAAVAAGYSRNHTGTYQIEESKAFKEISIYFKDELLQKITVGEIADELVKNIKQDENRAAKNQAIEIAIDKLEPKTPLSIEDSNVMIVLAPPNPRQLSD